MFLATRDTSKESEIKKKRLKKKKNNNFQKIKKPIWEFKELDYGRISDYVKVSPDGKYIAYAKYGYGKNQSLGWDLHLVDIDSHAKKRLTKSMRASNPCWSPDSKSIAFVSHKNSTANLFKCL